MRRKAEAQIAVLKEELKDSKSRLASFEKNMEERIRFDVLLSEISAHFINLPPDQVDREIEDAQRRVCECLGITMSSVWQWSPENPEEILLTHVYRPLGGAPVPPQMKESINFSWSFQQLMAGKMYVISSIEDLPVEAAPQIETWRYFGIKSSVGIPLSTGSGRPFGAITFHNLMDDRKWSDTIVKRLQLIAQVFANTLARKRSEELLRESEQRLSLATDAAGVGLWFYDLTSAGIWVSEQAGNLFHLPLGKESTFDDFLKNIHPEDRENVDRVMRQARRSKEVFQIDFRVVHGDGNICWLALRGSRDLDDGGTADRIMGVTVDITERKEMESQIMDSLVFESLLSEISSNFINLPANNIDGAIEDAQRRICEFLGLDLSALWQFLIDEPNTLRMTHVYRPLGGPPIPEKMDATDFFPWCQGELKADKTIIVSSMDNLPPEAAKDQEAWLHFGVKTSLTIPLKLGDGQPIGGLSFNDMRFERKWSEAVVNRLQLVAQAFANALSRKRSEEILRESAQRLHMATDASGTGLWGMDGETGKFWSSAKARELFEFSPDEDLDYAKIFEKVHPEDQKLFSDTVQQALHAGKPIQFDYRIMLSEGQIRWIHSCGERIPGVDGTPLRIMGTSVDATNRKHIEDEIRENLIFESLIADISTRFIDLAPEAVGDEIEEAQRQVCEYFGLGLAALWQWENSNPEKLIMTHIYRPFGGPPIPENMDAQEFFPWSQQELRSRRIIAVSSMNDLPPDAALDKAAYIHYGIKATLVIPLSTGRGTIFGGIGFNDIESERTWSETIIKRLRLVAQIFANALSRKRSEEILRESAQRLHMATDAAGTGLWVMDMDTEKVWISPRLKDLFYFAGIDGITYKNFFEKIHPDDQELVHKAVEQALQSGDPLHCDYRILLPDGHIRWICSRGQRYLNVNGASDRLMGVSINITDRVALEDQLRERIQEIAALKQRLEKENLYLQEEIKTLGEHADIVGQSLAMKRIITEAKQVAGTDSTVLILGETGTGKELLARAIHQMSARKNRPMVTINCAALPSSLIESELFGRERGAYTGAMTQMAGRFEIADGSTLFLDEIGELPMELQSKLLRVIEEGRFERLGSTKPLRVDVRIIAATNREIAIEAERGRFRKDLFYRLNVFSIMIPPLRERPEDIPLMVWAFIKEFKKRMGKEIETVSKKTMESLRSYAWPGNVRELRNVVERAMILSIGRELVVDLPMSGLAEKDDIHSLEDLERKHIVSVMEKTGWRVGGKGGASEILGLNRSTLYSRMKKLGITRPGL